MGRWRRTTACERAAQWISLELDGELSEIEGAALGRHVDHCLACAASRTELGGFTRVVRAVAPVSPREPVTVAMPRALRKQLVRRGAISVLVATTIAAGAGLFTLQQSPPVTASSTLGLATQQQRMEFAAVEGVRAEPQSLTATASPPAPFAARVLL